MKADRRRPTGLGKKPDVVWLPTPEKVVDAMLHLAGAGPGDVLYDLGSGDGRTAIAAAARFGVREAKGVEMRPHLLRRSRNQARRAGVKDRVRFVGGDLFRADLAGATVVTLYLLPRLNRKLRPRLLGELIRNPVVDCAYAKETRVVASCEYARVGAPLQEGPRSGGTLSSSDRVAA